MEVALLFKVVHSKHLGKSYYLNMSLQMDNVSTLIT